MKNVVWKIFPDQLTKY